MAKKKRPSQTRLESKEQRTERHSSFDAFRQFFMSSVEANPVDFIGELNSLREYATELDPDDGGNLSEDCKDLVRNIDHALRFRDVNQTPDVLIFGRYCFDIGAIAQRLPVREIEDTTTVNARSGAYARSDVYRQELHEKTLVEAFAQYFADSPDATVTQVANALAMKIDFARPGEGNGTFKQKPATIRKNFSRHSLEGRMRERGGEIRKQKKDGMC